MLKRLCRYDSQSQSSWLIVVLVVGLTFLRFAVSAASLPTLYFRADEWITMLAAKTIASRGQPLLPSGLFYDHGLLFSYLDGLVFALGGFNELMARWPGVLINTLAIPVAYRAGQKLFRSPLAGFLAAAAVLLDPMALKWGWTARMHGLGHALSWLLILSVWYATLQPHKARYRWLALGLALLCLMTHLSLGITIGALAIAWLVVSLGDAHIRSRWATQMNVARRLPEIGGILVVGGYALLSLKTGFLTNHETYSGSLSIGFGRLTGDFLWGWIHDSDARLYALLLPLVIIGILTWPISYRKSGMTRLNLALIFLYIALAVFVGAFMFIFGDEWWQANHLYAMLLPLYTLTAVGGGLNLAGLVSRPAWRLPSRAVPIGIGLSLFALLLVLSWSVIVKAVETTQRLTYPPGHPHAEAYAYVDQHWQSGDQIITTRMAICALYSEHCSYDISAKPLFIYNHNGRPENIYNGKPWLTNVADLAAILAEPGRVWLVGGSTGGSTVDEEVNTAFVQLGLTAMERVFSTDYVSVYREKDGLTPNHTLHANFADQAELLGYYLDETHIRPGKPAPITLFWRPLQPLPNYKVFVHLQNEKGETFGQFDHFPLGLLSTVPTTDWKVGKIFPDVALLDMPTDLSPGRYRLLIGLYDPASGARVPVIPDMSDGENAVAIELAP